MPFYIFLNLLSFIFLAFNYGDITDNRIYYFILTSSYLYSFNYNILLLRIFYIGFNLFTKFNVYYLNLFSFFFLFSFYYIRFNIYNLFLYLNFFYDYYRNIPICFIVYITLLSILYIPFIFDNILYLLSNCILFIKFAAFKFAS